MKQRLFFFRLPAKRRQKGQQQGIGLHIRQVCLHRRSGQILWQSGKSFPTPLKKTAQILSGRFEYLILLQPADKGLLRIFLFFLQGGRSRKKPAGFDIQQLGRHQQKVTGSVHLLLVHVSHRLQILGGDLGYEYILDPQLCLLYQL